jgi:release factor glutamine methyltransferase
LEFSEPRDLKALFDWGKDTLKDAGVKDHEISAEILLRHIVGLTRAKFFTSIDINPERHQVEQYKNHIERRARREPLQYITGETGFYNVVIKCDKRALIPRPETEILVQAVISNLRGIESPTILDIGTGSGNIAIALAKNIAGSKVIGIDISSGAIALARTNAEFTGTVRSLNFVVADISDDKIVRSLGRFDCVVANPPYVSPNQRELLQPEVTEYEPDVALFTSEDPLFFFKRIISLSPALLKPGALLAFEVGLGQARDVGSLMADQYDRIKIIDDLAGVARVVIGQFRG